PASAGVLAASRAPVRLLHARHAADARRVPARSPVAGRGRRPRGDLGQPLPLHGVSVDRRVGARRGGDASWAGRGRGARSARGRDQRRRGGVMTERIGTRAVAAESPATTTGTPWAALISACLGWMFDSMDLNIFTLLIFPSISELIGSRNPADIASVA